MIFFCVHSEMVSILHLFTVTESTNEVNQCAEYLVRWDYGAVKCVTVYLVDVDGI